MSHVTARRRHLVVARAGGGGLRGGGSGLAPGGDRVGTGPGAVWGLLGVAATLLYRQAPSTALIAPLSRLWLPWKV